MAYTRVLATSSGNGNDLQMQSVDTVYSRARTGPNAGASVTSAGANVGYQYNAIGQTKGGPGLTSAQFACCEYFASFPYGTIASTQKVVSAVLDIRFGDISGTVKRDVEYREGNWGVSIDVPGDFRPGESLGDYTLLATVKNLSNAFNSFVAYTAGGNALIERIVEGSSPLPVMATTNRQRVGNVPPSDERIGVFMSNYSVDAYKPSLRIQTITESNLMRVGGASAQLSDGTNVYVEYDGGSLTLKYSIGDTDGDISSLDTGDGIHEFDVEVNAWQMVTLAVDENDNIYVVGKSGANPNHIVVQAFEKSVGYSWIKKNARALAMPAYGGAENNDVPINNLTVTWHKTSNRGHLMVLGSHRSGTGSRGAVFWATVSCNNVHAGVTPYVADSGTDPAFLGLETPKRNAVVMPNDTGNMLDVWGDGLTGFAICLDSNMGHIGETFQAEVAYGRYTLNTLGKLSSSQAFDGFIETTMTLEPESKAKIVPIDGSRVAFCWAGRILVYDYAGSRLGGMSYRDFFNFDPAKTCATEYVYDPATRKIWFYYVDPALNARQVRRNGFGVDSFAYSVRELETVVGLVGPSGSTCLALRAPRGRVNERTARIEAAVRSGSTHSVELVNDSLNVAPSQPELLPRETFNAGGPATFEWTFSDPNTADAQTAFQLTIIDQSTSNIVHDTGKTSSSLPQYVLPPSTIDNTASYWWTVRVWDLADAASPYANYGSFNTISTAVTTITVPSQDNPADATTSRYTIQWSTQGLTQASYRITVVNLDNPGEFVLDTAWVVGTETSFELVGLQNGVTYQVTVTVRDSVNNEAQPGVRLITPQYTEPVTPIVTLSAEDGYVLVSVENPEPENGEPEPVANDIYRAPTGTADFIRIATIPNNGEHRDYSVRSGRTYTYYAVAVV